MEAGHHVSGGAIPRAIPLGLLLALSGCLHNAANFEMAKEAQKNFEDTKISASLDAERELSAKMQASELAAVQQEIEAQRDLALITILNGTINVFSNDIDNRLNDAFGGTDSAYKAYKAHLDLKNHTKLLGEALHNFEEVAAAAKVTPIPQLSCPLETEPSAVPAVLQGAGGYDTYKMACDRYLEVSKNYKEVLGKGSGRLGTLREQLKKESELLKSSEQEAAAKTKAYKAALAEYNNASKAVAAQGATDEQKQKLEALDTKVRAAFAALRTLADSQSAVGLPAGRIAELESRYDAVSQSMQNILAGTPRSDSLIEIALTAGTASATIEAQKQLPVLLLKAESIRGELEAAKTKARFKNLRQTLRERERDALMLAGDQLLKARIALDAVVSPPAESKLKACPKEQNVFDCFSALSGAQQVQLATALVHYASAWTLGDLPAHQARWMQFAAIHDEAIEQSAVAMQRWETLLSIPIAETVKFHGAGVKPADVAALLQALGVGVIAAGVVAQ